MLAMATDCEQQTDGHIRRVTEYVRFLITAIRNNPNGYMPTLEQENNIILVAKLHDIGKMAVPGYILRKPGKLTAVEFDVVRTHPLYGAMFLDRFMRAEGSAPFLAVARDIALYHHEKWDGTGYPFGYRGKKIPLSARIVAIADVYDALVSTRPYRSAVSHEEAIGIIKRDSGKHFDPYLVGLFLTYADAVRIISQSTDEPNNPGRFNL